MVVNPGNFSNLFRSKTSIFIDMNAVQIVRNNATISQQPTLYVIPGDVIWMFALGCQMRNLILLMKASSTLYTYLHCEQIGKFILSLNG